MYKGMDENGRPIPKIRRASLLASQCTVPLHLGAVGRRRAHPTPFLQVPPKKRPLQTWIIFLFIVLSFTVLINGVWMIVSHKSLAYVVLVQQLNQAQSTQQSQTLNASARVSVHHQSNRAEYNNDNPEWQLWSYSACSGCAMAALMDAYGAKKNGKPLNCGDVLEVEYKLGLYDPGTSPTQNRGLLPPGQPGLARTAAQFGFSADFSKNLSLDDLIKLANSGTPSIVGFPTHVMILKGGDSNDIFLADSGGLHLTIVTRDQFLYGLPGKRLYAGEAWINGWYITIKPN
jgi:hypothetical protein